MKIRSSIKGSALTLLLSSSLLGGCASDGEETVSGSGVIIDRSTDALLANDVFSMDGLYGAGCNSRATDAWTLSPTGTLNDLDVVKGDTDCVLTVEGLTAGDPAVRYVPETELAVEGAYHVSAVAFRPEGALLTDPVTFYANVMLSPVGYNVSFTVSILYSNDPVLAAGSNTATFAESTASLDDTMNPSSNYNLDMTGLLVTTNNDQVVDTATGNASLTAPGTDPVLGESYVVVLDNVAATPTYAELDDAYQAGVLAMDEVLVPVEDRSAFTIPAASFQLVGVDLDSDPVRTIIVAHTVNGVRSYQAFQVAFNQAIES